jgi:hypothetical protein
MDWIGDSDDFSYINYKSLESVLTVYPRSVVVVNLIASNGAQYYKMGNLISKHYFQKYLKYGYDVKVNTVYRTFRSRFENDSLPLGATYWNAQFAQCCSSDRAADINKYRVIPSHMYFYWRFYELYYHGGIYTDFSWLHTEHIPQYENNDDLASMQGAAVIQLSCLEEDADVGATLRPEESITPNKSCLYRSSSLLSFPKSQVVRIH